MATVFPASWPGWRALLPSLGLAYPVTVLLFQGGRACRSLCFEPTPAGVITVGLGLLATLLVGAGIASMVSHRSDEELGPPERWLPTPEPSVGRVLLGIFGLFVVLMILDALTFYESSWKPVALPVSFLLFFPVWALYMATFPLAVGFSTVGFTGSPVLSLVDRSLVVAIGFPMSVILQYYAVDAIIGANSRSQ